MPIRILIASAGRRNYLVEWFRHAILAEGLDGEIVVGDADREAPSRYSADCFVHLPRFDAPGYGTQLGKICTDLNIDLALSLNDYENSLWSELGLNVSQSGTKFLCPAPRVQQALEDKLAGYAILKEYGINVPLTTSATKLLDGTHDPSDFGSEVIIKNRFGSGSFGLRITTAARLLEDLNTTLLKVRDRRGRCVSTRDEAADQLVLQRHVAGNEYGMDIVNDFAGNFICNLVRKKAGMRDGETSSAITVAPESFRDIAKTIAGFTKHNGLIDTDIIRDEDGVDWAIDINPRFGGGYPFSHFAGANIPRLYLQWLRGVAGDPSGLSSYTNGVLAHKTISIVGDRPS